MKPHKTKYLLSLIKTVLISIVLITLISVVLRVALADSVSLRNSIVPGSYTPTRWEHVIFELDFGWFFDWFGRFIKGGLESFVIADGVPVSELISAKRGVTTEIILYAMIYSSVIGVPLGIISKRRTQKPIELLFRSIMVISLVLIAFLGIYYQYTLALKNDYFPLIGIKTPGFDNPNEITGLRLVDCLLSGRLDLFKDTFKFLVLPGLTLTLPSIGIVMWVTRNMTRNGRDIEFNAYKWIVSGMVGLIGLILLGITTELIFNLRGSGMLFIGAYMMGDYPVYLTMILNLVFTLVIFYIVLSIIANSIEYSRMQKEVKLRDAREKDEEPLLDKKPEHVKEQVTYQGENAPMLPEDRTVLRNRASVALSSIALLLIVGMVVYSVIIGLGLPNWEDFFTSFLPGQYEAPTPDHPWGTGEFGRDLFQLTHLTLLSLLAHIGIISIVILIIGGVLIACYVWLRGLKNQRNIKILTDLLKDFAFIGVFILGFAIFFAPNIIDSGTTDKFLTPYPAFFLYIGLFGGFLCFLLFSISKKSLRGKDRLKNDFILKLPKIIGMSIIISALFMLYYQIFNFLGIGIHQYSIGTSINDAKSSLITAPFATMKPLFGLILVSFILIWSFSSLEHTATLIICDPKNFSLKSRMEPEQPL